MLHKLIALWKDEDGPTSVEYALMLALISIVAIGAWQILGERVNTEVGIVNTYLPVTP
jgi:pilus assembly protein Flp/PilA